MKTNELVGHELNVAVHKALNVGFPWRYYGQAVPDYCNAWAAGGPIVERERLYLQPGPVWYAMRSDVNQPMITRQSGPTPLIAAMRCFVASRLGDEVVVKKEPK